MQSQAQRRRDFLVLSALAFTGVGAGVAVWPFVAQLAPNRSTRRDFIDIDLTLIKSGRMRQFSWRGLPILVRHRMTEEVGAARGTRLSELRDPAARVMGADAQLVASDDNRTKAGHEQWLVVVGLCTKDSCLTKMAEDRSLDEALFCPCCASRYDVSGRVRSGPAPYNLSIPPCKFLSPLKLRVG